MGEGCGHLEEDMCLYLDDNAISSSPSRASHRLVSKEEALRDPQARRGQRPCPRDESGRSRAMTAPPPSATAAAAPAYALRLGELLQRPPDMRQDQLRRQRWTRDKCVACGLCVDNCQTGAARSRHRSTVLKTEAQHRRRLSAPRQGQPLGQGQATTSITAPPAPTPGR